MCIKKIDFFLLFRNNCIKNQDILESSYLVNCDISKIESSTSLNFRINTNYLLSSDNNVNELVPDFTLLPSKRIIPKIEETFVEPKIEPHELLKYHFQESGVNFDGTDEDTTDTIENSIKVSPINYSDSDSDNKSVCNDKESQSTKLDDLNIEKPKPKRGRKIKDTDVEFKVKIKSDKPIRYTKNGRRINWPDYKQLLRPCETCGKMILNSKMQGHINKEHLHVEPFQCDIEDCTETFHCCHKLKEHKLEDHNPNSHMCNVCGKTFTRKVSQLYKTKIEKIYLLSVT